MRWRSSLSTAVSLSASADTLAGKGSIDTAARLGVETYELEAEWTIDILNNVSVGDRREEAHVTEPTDDGASRRLYCVAVSDQGLLNPDPRQHPDLASGVLNQDDFKTHKVP